MTKEQIISISRIVGKFIFWVVIVALILITIGLIRESITRHQLNAEYPAPGEMVSVNDHDLHLNCTGNGSPVVIFESDLDQYGSLSWVPVQEEISEVTRACSYDRAGILWSEPGPRPRDGETITTELKTLLQIAGEEGPYILVGHAFGGAYMRIFAGSYPEDVAGMVLVESSHPDMITRMREMDVDIDIPDKNIRPLIWLLSHLGMPGRDKGSEDGIQTEIKAPVRAFFPGSSMAWFDEKVESISTLALADEYQSLGDIPLIVLATSGTRESIKPEEKYQSMWLSLQEELPALSRNSEFRSYDIGHYPQMQQPEVVIEAIIDVLQETSNLVE